MVWDDYDREWKNWQRRFTQLEIEVTEAGRQAAARTVDQNRVKQLQAQLAAAEQNLQQNRDRADRLEEELAALDARLYRVNQDYQFAKARYDAEKYEYEALRDHDPAHAEEMGREIAERAERIRELNLALEQVTAERDAKARELGQFTGKTAELQREIDALHAEETRLATRIETLQPSFVKTYIRNAPMLDFMAPTIKIQQIITPNIVDDVNFTRVVKMDRCTTCHLAIEKKGYEKYPQPFRTHPNLDLYLGSASPHPMDQAGCTVCHEGMGQSVSFRDASHTPRSAEQRAEWEERHGWEVPHLWDYPMLPVGMTEASCAKCHKGEVFVPGARRLNTAYGLYERAGCYACHKTRGFEGLRKPGPSLLKIDSKLTPEWVKTWIRNPRAVKSSTWMPRVWYNSNSNSPADFARNEAEIDATVAYLFANSERHEFAVTAPPQGNPAAGKAIVESVGCLGCHVVDAKSRLEAGPRRTFGQPLQNIGSKTSYAWLYDWVRDPQHYSPGTYMPDLRLTDDQVADVAAYLASLKGPAGDAAKAAVEQKVVDEVLLDYLRATMTTADARAKVAAMDAGAKRLELGQRAIARYGCFSCHEIKGFEDTQPIGIELSEEGSKLLTQLDFGFVHDIPHTKLSWFEQKIRDPRVYDKSRELLPLERLRMPDWDATPEEAQLFTTAIMSFQREVQPLAALRPRSHRADNLITGRNLVRRRNCVACHVIEGDGGDYQQLVADPSLAPPLLTPEGAKVQPDWLYAFLRGPITIRPWLSVRMPTFQLDDGHWNDVIRYFAAVSNVGGPFRTYQITRASEHAGTGEELFKLLRCQQCHVLGAIPKDQPTANLAPDLRMTPERLRPEWILEWLKAPARIQPGTRMPAFWPEYPKSYYPHLNGSAEEQIRAIRDHLLTLRGGPSPRRPPTVAGATIAPN
jgi:mono/diheme cytochrome c family protein